MNYFIEEELNYFMEEEHVFFRRVISAEYFFEMISFQFFVIKNKNYFEWKNIIDKRNQFCIYIIVFLRFFFYFIEIFFNYIFSFLKVTLVIFKTFFKKIFLGQTKVKKKFLVNDLYNSFSTKILISSTAFFVLYLIILLFFLYLLYFTQKSGENLFSKKNELLENQFFKNQTILENLFFCKKFVLFTRFADWYLECCRVHVPGFTPILYKSDKSPIYKTFVIHTSLYYAYQLIGYTITESQFEELNKQLEIEVLNRGNLEEMLNYKLVVFGNKLMSQKIFVVECVENVFEAYGITCEDHLDQIFKEKLLEIKIDFSSELRLYGSSDLSSFYDNADSKKLLHFLDTFFFPYFADFSDSFNFSNFFNFKFILQINILILIISLMNLLHTFIAFLSLGYDYLLKKLTFENILILYIISSTTLQVFLKVLFIYLF